jgi:hypothetical protein
MSLLGRHLLAYVCSLFLVIPAGWCCQLPGICDDSDGCGDAGRPAATCCCCERPADEPTDADPPAPPAKCPCIEKAAPTSLAADQFEPAALSTLLPLFLQPAALGGELIAQTEGVFADIPLHLLHCVWLC